MGNLEKFSHLFLPTRPNTIPYICHTIKRKQLILIKFIIMVENYNMVVVPQVILENISKTLSNIENLLQKKSEEELANQWLESTLVRKILGISAKTWQTYRDERKIPFSQFGRKIYVKKADLEAFMKQHYICARNQKGGIV